MSEPSTINDVDSLRSQLAVDPLNSEGHWQLVQLLMSSGEKLEAEKALEAMSTSVALTEEQWLHWIHLVESRVDEGLAEFPDLLKLCFQALTNWRAPSLCIACLESVASLRTKRSLPWSIVWSAIMRLYGTVEYDLVSSQEPWIWTRDYMVQELQVDSSQIAKVQEFYLQRLQVPHLDIARTFSDFSSFITQHNNSGYEEEMVKANRLVGKTRKAIDLRDSWELKVRAAPQDPDVWEQYIQWEQSLPKQKSDFRLGRALFERSLLHIPDSSTIWNAYVSYLWKYRWKSDALELCNRALRSCPRSSLLWSRRFRLSTTAITAPVDLEALLTQFDLVRKLFSPSELGEVDTTEIYAAYYDWYVVMTSYLFYLRQVVAASVESPPDYFEEAVESIVSEIVNIAAQFSDQYFRLEHAAINILTEVGAVGKAEQVWSLLIPVHCTKAIFWSTRFEWYKSNIQSKNYSTTADKLLDPFQSHPPILVDSPELLLQRYVEFFEAAGDVDAVEDAMARVQELSILISNLRTESAADVPAASMAEDPPSRTRPREPDGEEDEPPRKKVELEEPSPESKKQDNQEGPSRNREEFSIIVSNLPSDTSEKRVRAFFTGCGEINAVQLTKTSDDTATAILEMSSADGVLSALTRDLKKLDDHEVRVVSGRRTTLWVTNFPETYGSDDIRLLFGRYGTILSVRLPSLKFNTRRRFCYVQFSSAGEASEAAAGLNGKSLDGKSLDSTSLNGSTNNEKAHVKLIVKVSDPDHKQAREAEPANVIIVKGLDFTGVTEQVLRETFKPMGNIQKLVLPKSKHSKDRLHDGYAFITFESAEAAAESVSALHDTELLGRKISVSIPTPQVPKQSAHVTDNNRVLYVSNVADVATEGQLRKLFEPFGAIEKLQLRPDQEGAVITFELAKDAGKAALALEGRQVEGRPIRFGAAIRPPVSKTATIFVPRTARRRK